jgi:hypothetical protein
MTNDDKDDTGTTETELNAKGVILARACDACGRSDWNINPGTFVLPSLEPPISDLAVRTIACGYCGNVRMFDASMLGAAG